LRKIVSKSHRTTAAEVNIHLEDRVSINIIRRDVSFTNAISTVGLQLLNFSLLKVMLRYKNDSVTNMKPGHQTSGNACVICQNKLSFRLFLTSVSKSLRLENTQGRVNSECLVPTMKRGGGGYVMVWAKISWYNVLLVPLLSFVVEQGNTWSGWVIKCIS
jgi:hypothetical protein